MSEANGIILLKKTSGLTSFKALSGIKRVLKEHSGNKVKVGHTGTLDQFASGLLVVLSGKYTRLNQIFSGFDKKYSAVIKFGETTETLDPEGAVIGTGLIPDLTLITEKIETFKGSIEQIPPKYSAVHVNGKRAYKMALKGQEVNIPSRKVYIYSFEVTSWQSPFLSVDIHCSKGTYIRSLARDLGQSCGTCAYLTELKRTEVGPFSLNDAVSETEFNPESNFLDSRAAIEAIYKHNMSIGILELKQERRQDITHGSLPDDSFFDNKPEFDGTYAVYSNETLCAVIEYSNNNYRYLMVTL